MISVNWLFIGPSIPSFPWQIVVQEGDISVSQTVMVKVEQGESDDAVKDVMVSWGLQDDALGTALLNLVENIGR